ncbi:MAG: hypothetical protein AB7J28_15855 [Hyphomonadaceae bacterium]
MFLKFLFSRVGIVLVLGAALVFVARAAVSQMLRAESAERTLAVTNSLAEQTTEFFEDWERIEVRHVNTVRIIERAGPLSAACAADPRFIAAGAGTLQLRRDYCAEYPGDCAADGVSGSVDRGSDDRRPAAGSGAAGVQPENHPTP